jgi:hypothetical protein
MLYPFLALVRRVFPIIPGYLLSMTYGPAGELVDDTEQAGQIHSGPGWSLRERSEET